MEIALWSVPLALGLREASSMRRDTSFSTACRQPLGAGAGKAPSGHGPRILLASHDSYGLGHLRRNVHLASALVARHPGASVLLVTGSPLATYFETPPGVEIVKLPSVTKDAAGAYVPRRLPGSLALTLRLRRALLLQAYRAFAPELVVVDHQVLGLHGEVAPLLREARRQGVRTILGVRDVVDAPGAVAEARADAEEWGAPESRRALEEDYDRICVYGSPEVFDPRVEYPLPIELADRLEFCGYVGAPAPAPHARTEAASGRPQRVLVTMGGGEDGARRISLFLDALALRAPAWEAEVVLGPLLEPVLARRLERRARRIPGVVRVHRHAPDVPRLLRRADAVVGMAGYNSCVEVLQAAKPAVYLPRTFPRREQEIRAGRFERLGLARSIVRPEPGGLRMAVERSLQQHLRHQRIPSLDGCQRLCEVAGELLSLPRTEGRTRAPQSIAL